MRKRKAWRSRIAFLMMMLILATVSVEPTMSWAADKTSNENVESDVSSKEEQSNESASKREKLEEVPKETEQDREEVEPSDESIEKTENQAEKSESEEEKPAKEEPAKEEPAKEEPVKDKPVKEEPAEEAPAASEAEVSNMAEPRETLSGKVNVTQTTVGNIVVDYPVTLSKSPSWTEASPTLSWIYEGNGVNKTYRGYSFGNQSFSSKSLSAGTLPDISMRYYEVGVHNGEAIDVEVTCTSLKNGTPHYREDDRQWYYPTVQFREDNIGVYTTAVSDARFDFKFYKTGTNTVVAVMGNGTLYDLDGEQTFTLFGADNAYITNDSSVTVENLGSETVFQGQYDLMDNDSPSNYGNGCVSFTFNRGRISVKFGDPRHETGRTSFFGFSAEGVVDSNLPDPIKKVSDEYQIKNFEEFNYHVMQTVPYLHDKNILRRFEVKDRIADCLEFTGEYHIEWSELGTNQWREEYWLNNQFNVSFNGNTILFASKASTSYELPSDFYNKDYRFRFRVRMKQGYDLSNSGYNYTFNTGNGGLTVDNYATRTHRLKSETYSESKDTNTVTLTAQTKRTTVTKVDGSTNRPITGTSGVFEIYYLNQYSQEVSVGRCTYDYYSGVITTPYLPCAAVNSNFTYYLKEVSPPGGGYIAAGPWKIVQSVWNGSISLEGGTNIKNYKPSISKKLLSAKQVKKGDIITYRLVLTNPGSASLTVTVRDPLPWQASTGTYKLYNRNGYTVDQSGYWSGSKQVTIPANSTINLDILAEVKAGFDANNSYNNEISNQAFMDYSGNTMSTEIVYNYLSPNPDFEVVKLRTTNPTNPSSSSKKGFMPGEQVRYQVTVTNTGDVPFDLNITDVFQKSGIFTFNGSNAQSRTLEVGQSVYVYFYVTVNRDAAPGEYENVVTVKGTGSYRDPETGSYRYYDLTKEATASTPVMWRFYKINEDGFVLNGLSDYPEFTIYENYSCTYPLYGGTSSFDRNTGMVYFPTYLTGGLDTYRTYYMKETHTPSGYWPNQTIYTLQVDGNGRITISAPDGSVQTLDYATGKIGIVNEKKPVVYRLPNTGGIGTYAFTFIGITLMTLASLVVMRNRERGKDGR